MTKRAALGRAESLVNALAAEAAAREEQLPGVIRVRRAEIHFWQGRFEEARQALASCDAATPGLPLWRALTSWGFSRMAVS